MQMTCGKLISFIDDERILIISSSNDSIELWDCSKNILLSNYDFTDDIIEDCTYAKPVLKVTLKQNRMITYFSIEKDYQFKSNRNTE